MKQLNAKSIKLNAEQILATLNKQDNAEYQNILQYMITAAKELEEIDFCLLAAKSSLRKNPIQIKKLKTNRKHTITLLAMLTKLKNEKKYSRNCN